MLKEGIIKDHTAKKNKQKKLKSNPAIYFVVGLTNKLLSCNDFIIRKSICIIK